MGQKLKNAPVFFTIGQVQHNPLLSLGTYIPEIQERMRRAGFPGFEQKTQVQVAFQASLDGADEGRAAPTIQKHESYVFSDLDGVQGFILHPTSISFQTTSYDCFDVFYDQFERGFELVNEVVGGLSFVERLGLRYVDAVVPRDGEDLKLYLAPSLLGLPAAMENSDFSHTFSESVLTTDGREQVIARTVIQSGSLTIPPDLFPNSLKLQERFERVNGVHATLDTDGFCVERRPCNIPEVRTRMYALHGLIEQCFEASVTDYARSIWKG